VIGFAYGHALADGGVLVRRRELLIALGGAVTYPLATHAQQKAMPVIGIIGGAGPDDPTVALNLAAFRQGLGDTGFVDGRNVAIETAGSISITSVCPPWPPNWSPAMSM